MTTKKSLLRIFLTHFFVKLSSEKRVIKKEKNTNIRKKKTTNSI
jgi:hypothetical protein